MDRPHVRRAATAIVVLFVVSGIAGSPMLPGPMVALAATPPPVGLVFWNTLGSSSEVLHSALGPNLTFYADTDCSPDRCFGPGIDVKGNAAFVPGKVGTAVTIGEGTYFSQQREHTLVLHDAQTVVNTERGTIDVWYKQLVDPVGYQNGIYRIFDGPYGLEHEQVAFWADASPPGARLGFGLRFGATDSINVLSKGDGQPGASLAGLRNRWLHLLGMWDRAGIDGTTDTMRLYIDGVVVASTRASGWGKVPATIVDIAGGNDQAIARTFVVDELKLWSHANTPPRCAIAVSAGPPTQVRATLQSNRSGLAAIAVSKAVNATVAWPAFLQGTTGPVLVTATKTNQVLPAQVELQVTDRAGNVTTCDPALAEVTAHRAGAVQVFKDIPASEHVVTIMNGRPGLSDLRLLVNGRHLVVQLRAGEERTIDIAGAMHAGSNTILAIGRGRRGASAELMVWDGGQ
jgi:hypothetical protein